MMKHEVHERRSLAMHGLVADRLEKNPELLDLARQNLEECFAQCSAHVHPALREEKEILQTDLKTVCDFLRSPSEKAISLR